MSVRRQPPVLYRLAVDVCVCVLYRHGGALRSTALGIARQESREATLADVAAELQETDVTDRDEARRRHAVTSVSCLEERRNTLE